MHPRLFATLVVLAALGGCSSAPPAVEEDAAGDPCVGQSDCAAGLECIADVCVDFCDDIDPCATPEVCVGRQCVPPGPCDDGRDCGGIDACVDGQCTPVPELARCDETLVWDPLLNLAGPEAPVQNLGFRDADGDAARELVGTQGRVVSQVRGGEATAQVLFTAPDTDIRALEIVDLDLDGLDDVVVASWALTFLDADGESMPGPVQDFIFTDLEAVDDQPGIAPQAGVGLGMCTNQDQELGCPPELRGAWGGPAMAMGSSAAHHAQRLASGDFLGSGGRYLLVGERDGFFLFLPDRVASIDRDRGVVGGVFAVGDLDADGIDDVIRVTAREAWTLATVWQFANGEFKPGRRVRLAGEYGRAIGLGDVDGDGRLDAVLGGPDGIGIWAAPGDLGCLSVRSTTHTVARLTVGDHDGDGRGEVAIADDEQLTILSARPL